MKGKFGQTQKKSKNIMNMTGGCKFVKGVNNVFKKVKNKIKHRGLVVRPLYSTANQWDGLNNAGLNCPSESMVKVSLILRYLHLCYRYPFVKIQKSIRIL